MQQQTRLYFLKEIVDELAADRVALEVEDDVHVLAEAARVVVAVRFRIAEALEYVIGLDEYVLDALDVVLAARVRDVSDVFEDDFGRLGFAFFCFLLVLSFVVFHCENEYGESPEPDSPLITMQLSLSCRFMTL